MNFYQRNLPHWQPFEAEYFVTFRLAGSIPQKVVSRIKNKLRNLAGKSEADTEKLSSRINRLTFQKYERYLEGNNPGPYWLRKSSIAKLLCEAIEYRNGKKYDLYSYCVMPNHVHLVFKLFPAPNNTKYPVTKIIGSLKQYTAREANKLLQRKGQFWQHESFDRVIRDNEN
jgi:hypothetical protein